MENPMNSAPLIQVSKSEDSPRSKSEAMAMRLVGAVQRLSLARSLEAIIEIVRKAAREICGADGASVILRDGDLCHYVDEDALSPLWKGQRFPMANCISGWSMLNRRSAIIEDIYSDPRIPHNAYRRTFVKSLVVIPIRTEQPIGAIGIYWADYHLATTAEVELLQALANTTSVAFENVRLYDELEERVEERTRQLEDANRELEAFSYSVSHDLQAPVRHITGYLGMLTADCGDTLTPEVKIYLARIGIASERMAELIQNLLRLARFSHIELRTEKINLSAIARGIAMELRDETPDRAVEVRIQEGMEITSDAALIGVILDNLFRNAWKFTSKTEKALIEFTMEPGSNGKHTYRIKDNGAGFDMQYADKLFCPFVRLHSEREFKGSGIGLATVDKIVRKLGGRIWAEAVPRQGATFSFYLS